MIFLQSLNSFLFINNSRAITSHLQTHGCTVVIGDDIKAVNSVLLSLFLLLTTKFVDSLSLFLINANERNRSSYAIEGRAYVPDLVLQGVLAVRLPITPFVTTLGSSP